MILWLLFKSSLLFKFPSSLEWKQNGSKDISKHWSGLQSMCPCPAVRWQSVPPGCAPSCLREAFRCPTPWNKARQEPSELQITWMWGLCERSGFPQGFPQSKKAVPVLMSSTAQWEQGRARSLVLRTRCPPCAPSGQLQPGPGDGSLTSLTSSHLAGLFF